MKEKPFGHDEDVKELTDVTHFFLHTCKQCQAMQCIHFERCRAKCESPRHPEDVPELEETGMSSEWIVQISTPLSHQASLSCLHPGTGAS